jgi:hypothetical protein
MGNTVRHLQVVPFSGNDFSLGEHLLERDGTTSTDPLNISNKLSLLFHYEDYAWVGVTLPGAGNKIVPCRISYDQTEAVPTELYLTLKTPYAVDRLAMIKRATVSFEIFRVCYEFSAEVLNYNSDGSVEFHLVLSIPEELSTIKHRRLPRVRIDQEDREKLPKIYLNSSNEPLQISELGLNSIAVDTVEHFTAGEYELDFRSENNLKCRATGMIRGEKLVFCLLFENAITFGQYFNIYRKFAYPGIQPRSDFDNLTMFDLYEKTGYFGGFLTDESKSKGRQDLLKTWEAVPNEAYDVTADFVTTDKQGTVIGASSVSLAFRDTNFEYWAFHQLCSIKSPDLLTASGHLYMWRADYLIGLPQDLKVVVWFRSESRWLERIYVKFARQSSERVRIHPVKLIKGQFTKTTSGTPSRQLPKTTSYSYGSHKRTVTVSDNLISGIGPDFLNASGLLNNVSFLDGNDDKEAIQSAMTALMENSGTDTAQFYVSLPEKSETTFEGWKITPSDRFCIFSKNDLIDFLSSVEHSIAVIRKKAQG